MKPAIKSRLKEIGLTIALTKTLLAECEGKGAKVLKGEYRAQLDQLRKDQFAIFVSGNPLVIAVDPAIHSNGFAYRLGVGQITVGSVFGIENIKSGAAEVATLHPDSTVYAFIEYPVWGGARIQQTRAAANTWERVLKAEFPRRVKVIKKPPQSWMCGVLGDIRKIDDHKAAYRLRATEIMHEDRGELVSLSEDEAAAVCMLEYTCKQIRNEGWFLETGRREK